MSNMLGFSLICWVSRALVWVCTEVGLGARLGLALSIMELKISLNPKPQTCEPQALKPKSLNPKA